MAALSPPDNRSFRAREPLNVGADRKSKRQSGRGAASIQRADAPAQGMRKRLKALSRAAAALLAKAKKEASGPHQAAELGPRGTFFVLSAYHYCPAISRAMSVG